MTAIALVPEYARFIEDRTGVISTTTQSPTSREYLDSFPKKAFDRAAAAAALVLGGEVLIGGLMALNKVLYPGESPLYQAKRVGKHGRPITVTKIRTVASGNGEAPIDKIPDSAVTPFARRLRRWTVDESPQLVSVMKGEMSMIGIRAIPEWDIYNVAASVRRDLAHEPDLAACLMDQWRTDYYNFAPSLIGIPQLYGSRELSALKRICYDLWYMDHASLDLDLKVFLSVPRKILRGRGFR